MQLRYQPHRGFFVTELSRDELVELCQIRSVLEALAVERGLGTLAPDELESMRGLLTQMDAADRDGDVLGLIRLDREFHFAVLRAAKMPHLERVISLTWDQSDPYRAAFFADAANRVRNRDEHRLGPTQHIPRLADPSTL